MSIARRSILGLGFLALASAFAFILALSGVASADDETCPDPRDLCVNAPFNSTTAIENLKKCVKVEDGDAEKLSRIQQIRYLFDPPNGEFDHQDIGSQRIGKQVDPPTSNKPG